MAREPGIVVGKLHAHLLPEESEVGQHGVARCRCGKEFFVDTTSQYGNLKWFPLDDSPHMVEYPVEPTEDNPDPDPVIGRWTPPVEEGQSNGPTSNVG
jgi:hypothetical protein